ncbi:MAG: arylesterase [Acidobacteriota bacterium]|jgi:acyl-CoA thioesterase-1
MTRTIGTRDRGTGLRALACAAVLAGLVQGCGPDATDFAPRAAGAVAPEPSAAAVRVVFLGDSLTAGPGLAKEETYPSLIENRLLDEGYDVEVINAGVSGDTTAGGLARLDWLLDQDPDLVVVGLGANDGLRGQPLDATEENLRAIVRRIRGSGAHVLLLGMKIPPSQGLDYARRFEELYPRVADDLDVPLVPFLLEDVAARPSLNLPDRIHPNARGHRHLAATVYPHVEDLLGQVH